MWGGARAARATAVTRELGMAEGSVLLTSAHTREGQEELREAVRAFLA